ncbi:serine hydrolase domain-containing protein [Streptomyces halobius]|uniref:Beta-lactamase family protein n=1 Tax=Streptomyces halobius TaxID=2879846 RepID=A0ABY4MGS9_9ACTN|nr:serine hydrolase domain-containing protein [Streptomyces halobius]UQA96912.1 beta-lactamase family protein [Streptomyces halobius]
MAAVMAVVAAALAVGGAPARAGGSADVVRQALVHLVRDDGYPAALAADRGRHGRIRHYTAGVADLRTGAEVPVNGQVRVGSNTKTFTATVVLQLVGEGRVALGAPVEKYLPNLVRGKGIDGRRITVRQLLQHTSGLPNYTDFIGDPTGKERHTYVRPRALLDLALAHKAHFAPGARWEYSNTNYLLAGLIIEKVTGRPLAEEITRRVIERIGLRHTYFPAAGDESIREAHPEGYAAKGGGVMKNITELDPSWAWAAGQMISTPGDLNRFFSALLGGRFLRPAQLARMRTTVAVPAGRLWPGARYGLGVIGTPMSCGGLMWGHGGDIPGYGTRTGVTDDGRAFTVAVTADSDSAPVRQGPADVQAAVDTALCR